MKGKRLLATMLALLLMVSLLPMAAMADDNPAGGTITTTTKDIGTNNGKIENNNHTVENNVAVQKNSEEGEESPPSYQSGTGHIVNNNDGGKVVNNNAGATVQFNNAGATVQNNNAGATVQNNKDGGIIDHNSGYVGEWRPDVQQFQTTSGNKGTVGDNTSTGKVNNLAGGKVVDNSGTVSNDEGSTVENNNAGGTVNNNGGKVVNNYGGTEVNDKGGVVNNNGGTVVNNYGGTGVNNKGVVNNNGGTVVNNYGATGEDPNAGGTVENNGGTVVSNSGTVYNNTEGSVVQVNEVDGYVANNSLGPDADGPKVEINFGTVQYAARSDKDQPTYYGVHYEDESKNKVYINQFKADTDVSISDLNISRPGYKLVKCEMVEGYNIEDNHRFVDVTDREIEVDGVDRTVATRNEDGSVRSFILRAPTRLKLLWEKIVTAVAPAASNEPEAKPVKAAALPTTVAAEDVKVGTVVRVKGQLFRVIELDDGSMTVVTMGKLSGKDMEDLMAFLAKYFTPEQLELLLGDPELISGALAEELFGGNTGHIVFKAARNLFA